MKVDGQEKNLLNSVVASRMNHLRLLGFTFAAVGIVIFALFLRLFQIDLQPLWVDEAFSFFVATSDEWPQDLLRENNPPLYFLLLRSWILLTNQSEYSLRLLSALLGSAFIIATIWAGCVIFNHATGLYSGFFAAIAPMHIYYSQEARSYVLLTLALMLGYGSLWKAIDNKQGCWWYIFAICMAAALYSHHFALLALAPTFLVVMSREYRHYCLKPYLWAVMSATLTMLLWLLPGILSGASIDGEHNWIGEIWERTPPSLAIPKSLELLGIGSQRDFVPVFLKQFTLLDFPPLLRWIGVATIVILAIAALLLPLFQNGSRVYGTSTKTLWLAFSLLFPLGCLWLISLYRPYYVAGRYDIIVFPVYSLLVGLGIIKLHYFVRLGPIFAASLFSVLVFVLAIKLYHYYALPAVDHGDSAVATARILADNVKDGDTVLLSGTRMLPVLYELKKHQISRQGETNCIDQNGTRLFVCLPVPHDDSDMSVLIGADREELQHIESSLEMLNWMLEHHSGSGDIWLGIDYFRNVDSTRKMRSFILGLNQLGYLPLNSTSEMHRLNIQHFRLQEKRE